MIPYELRDSTRSVIQSYSATFKYGHRFCSSTEWTLSGLSLALSFLMLLFMKLRRSILMLGIAAIFAIIRRHNSDSLRKILRFGIDKIFFHKDLIRLYFFFFFSFFSF